jgi:hypothetical protein
MKPEDKLPKIGETVRYCGKPATVSAIGWVGERYYWLTLSDGTVAMIPAAGILELLG